ncbi:MAG: M15 family metallopeptidase [Eubacterium sp.]|nr:M15 family metallopeptidase [Eubacterium sp.]
MDENEGSLYDRIFNEVRPSFSLKRAVIIIAVMAVILFASTVHACVSLATGMAAGLSGSYDSASKVSLSSAEYKIYSFFRDKGYGDVQIAAILGNLKQEKSDFDPTYDTGRVLGIMQWTGGSRTSMMNWCRENGYGDSIYTLDTQLVYMYESWIPKSWHFPAYKGDHAYPEEYRMTYSEWLAVTDVDLATGGFCACSEKPYYKDESGNDSRLEESRIPYAREYLIKIQSGALGGAGEAAYVDYDERMAYLFPNGVPQTESQMQQYLTSIEVPGVDAGGNRITCYITCHEKLAGEICACFEEMAAMGFPIKPSEVACYGWRVMASGTGSLSHHSYGVAVDINWNSNPAVYWGYSPNPLDPYCINQAVVGIWKKHGFFWGGDWTGGYYDPMHFTYTDH